MAKAVNSVFPLLVQSPIRRISNGARFGFYSIVSALALGGDVGTAQADSPLYLTDNQQRNTRVIDPESNTFATRTLLKATHAVEISETDKHIATPIGDSGKKKYATERGFWNDTNAKERMNPKRSYNRGDLNKDIKDAQFWYRWYRKATFGMTIGKQLEFAKKYGNLPKDKYLDLWVKDENDPKSKLAGKLCRAYVPPNPKGKPIYIFGLGHTEYLNKDPRYAGTIEHFNRVVKEKKGIALLFRTGFAVDELKTWFNLNGDYAYDPRVILQNTKNIINLYAEKYKKDATGFRMYGYSRWGGTILHLSKDEGWRQDLPVDVTVMLDPVENGCTIEAVREKPSFEGSPNHRHIHIYQVPQINPLGGPLSDLIKLGSNYPIKKEYYWYLFYKTKRDKGPKDVHWDVRKDVPTVHHKNIDDLPIVKQWIWHYLNNPVKK